MTLYKVHRITSFAQYFNIMSRQFFVATALLWHSRHDIGHREFPKISLAIVIK